MGKDNDPQASGKDRIREIHAIALAEILTKSRKLDAWRYFRELSTFKQPRPTVQWLEALVMVCCAGRIRHTRVIGCLRRLKQRQGAEQFEIFHTRIRDYIAPLVLTNHGFRKENFALIDPSSIWAHVEALTTQLEAEGFSVFLNSGTLLGVTRDQSLIAHDDDVDLAVILNADSTKSAAAEWHRLANRLQEAGMLDKAKQKAPEFFKLEPVGNFEVDLFPAWIEDGRVYVYPHTFGELAQDDLLPLQVCAVTGRQIPRAPDKMLAVNYGEGWRAPDPFFTFPWGRANAKFAEFMQELRA